MKNGIAAHEEIVIEDVGVMQQLSCSIFRADNRKLKQSRIQGLCTGLL
ncbi:hypothetical protein H7F33_13855 [Pedobacter sp. PAMC26386]|nr:hypothetical protein H7F33_13855 [Pedobacter sp. PAMC26386]